MYNKIRIGFALHSRTMLFVVSSYSSLFTKLLSILRLLLICMGGGYWPNDIVKPPERTIQLYDLVWGSITPIRLLQPSLLHKFLSCCCQHLCNVPRASFSRTSSLRYIYLLIHAHDDVIKWRHFPRYCPFVRGIHQSPVNSPHKGQWHRASMFSLICARISGWVNTGDAGDLRRHRAHYDVIVMNFLFLITCCLQMEMFDLRKCSASYFVIVHNTLSRVTIKFFWICICLKSYYMTYI